MKDVSKNKITIMLPHFLSIEKLQAIKNLLEETSQDQMNVFHNTLQNQILYNTFFLCTRAVRVHQKIPISL